MLVQYTVPFFYASTGKYCSNCQICSFYHYCGLCKKAWWPATWPVISSGGSLIWWLGFFFPAHTVIIFLCLLPLPSFIDLAVCFQHAFSFFFASKKKRVASSSSSLISGGILPWIFLLISRDSNKKGGRGKTINPGQLLRFPIKQAERRKQEKAPPPPPQ